MEFEKQIEEMGKTVLSAILLSRREKRNNCKYGLGGICAEALINAGYGNVREVVKEFAERVKGRYGDLVRVKEGRTTKTRIFEKNIGYLVDPETVGEYIGKEDKKGKKIFEGDILDYCFSWTKTKIYGRVGFSYEHVGYFLYDKNFEMTAGIGDCKTMKVVGNKFDTPELWKVEE